MTTVSFVYAQNKSSIDANTNSSENEIKYKHSIGASFFMLGNLAPDPADYYLITYGYRFIQ